MALHFLTLAALKDLDGGRVYEAFDQAKARRAVADCEDRPSEERGRAITLWGTWTRRPAASPANNPRRIDP
jgi:hypothetical protein